MKSSAKLSRGLAKGFTLVEALVAIALITIISLVVLGALAPWMGMKQTIDTERKLQDIKQGVMSLYDSSAMAIENDADGVAGPLKNSTLDANGSCVSQETAFVALSGRFSEGPQQLAKDGFQNPWCIFISVQKDTSKGVNLYYRNIAIVSTGRDGVKDAATKMDASGNLITGGDDFGVVISGYDIQSKKLTEALSRMNRIAGMYETYFTTRFISYPDRDITRYYFSTAGDASGAVPSTGGAWAAASTALAGIGVSAPDSISPWEKDNAIEVGNFNESVNGITVRSPASSGTGTLPYTAVLRTRIPAPSGSQEYVTKVVVGNY